MIFQINLIINTTNCAQNLKIHNRFYYLQLKFTAEISFIKSSELLIFVVLNLEHQYI